MVIYNVKKLSGKIVDFEYFCLLLTYRIKVLSTLFTKTSRLIADI